MIKKIKNIIIGWYRYFFGYYSKEYEKRLYICSTCEHKKKITKNIEICDLCGCVLKSKAAVKDEKCLKNKW